MPRITTNMTESALGTAASSIEDSNDISFSPMRALVPRACAIVAILCGAAGLCGWVLDNAWLRSFGREDHPVHPLSAITYIALALASLAAMGGRRKLALSLLATPLIYLIGFAFQTIAQVPIPIERLLWPDEMALYTMANGPPFSITACMISLLTVTVGFATRPDRAADRIVIALASVALGVSFLGVAIIYLENLKLVANGKIALLSAPATFQAFFIAAALSLWRGRIGWFQLLLTDPGSAASLSYSWRWA